MLSSLTLKEWSDVHLLIDRSEFKQSISFFTKLRLPSIDLAYKDDLYFMEAFIRLLIMQGFQTTALMILEKILSRVRLLGSGLSPLLAKLLIHKSQIDIYHQRYQPIRQQLQEASKLLNDQNSPNMQSDYGQIYLLYARLEEEVQDWERYLDEALNCFKATNYGPGEVAVLNSFGVLFGRLKDNELARDYFEKGIEISTRIHDLRRLAGCYNNLAVLYYFESEDSDNHPHGKQLLEEAINISSNIESWEFLAQHYLAIIQYYQKCHQYRNALPYLNLLYQVQEKRGMLNPDQKISYQNILSQKNIKFEHFNTNGSLVS